MGKHFFKTFLVVSAGLCGLTSAYVIDTTSCTGETRTYLKTQIDCAFNVVQAAVDAINDHNRDARITALLNNLIQTSTDNTYVTPAQAVLGRFNGVQPAGIVGGMTFGYPGVLSMRHEATGTPHNNDVKFYCDTKRFIKLTGGDHAGRYVDEDRKELIPEEQGNSLKDCNGMTMAVTYVPESGKPDESKQLWSTITMCPWFLSYAQKANWPECGSFATKFKSLSAKALDSLVTKVRYTDIDLFSLFDKVIIHELTHTRSGGETKDAKMNRDGPYEVTNLAYGFKNCRAISGRRVGIGESRADETPHYNADTFAIFASGVRLINSGGSVDNNGKVTKPTNQKRWPLVAVDFEA